MPIRVLIAEDNEDLREVLRALIGSESDMHCVGVACEVDEVIANANEENIDVLVLDLELQGRSSIAVLRAVRRAGTNVAIVVFSGHAHPDMIRHTLAAGADAFVPKSGDFDRLLDAIRAARPVPPPAPPRAER